MLKRSFRKRAPDNTDRLWQDKGFSSPAVRRALAGDRGARLQAAREGGQRALGLFFLAPTVLRGNPYRDALRNSATERCHMHSLAGEIVKVFGFSPSLLDGEGRGEGVF